MLFEFGHVSLGFSGAEIWCKEEPWTIRDLKRALTGSQMATAKNGWYPIFFENHDKPRSINHYFFDQADRVLAGRALGTILLTLRGTPFLYQGEEIGMTNVRWESIDDYDKSARSLMRLTETSMITGRPEDAFSNSTLLIPSPYVEG